MNHLDTDWSDSSSNDRLRLLIISGLVLVVMIVLGSLFVGTDGLLKMIGLKSNNFQGSISISVEPDDAQIRLDFQQVSAAAPLEISWQRGTEHVIDVTHPSFLTEKLSIRVPESPDEPLEFSRAASNITIDAETSDVTIQFAMISEFVTRTIESKPSKAAIEINGIDTGKTTPMEFEFRLNEPVKIKAQRKGYEPAGITVTVTNPENSEPFKLVLKKKSQPRSPHGLLKVSSKYPVSVFEGKKRLIRNKKNSTVRLTPGTHTLRVVNAKYQLQQSETITVKDGKTHRITIEPPGKVNLKSSPAGAEVIINEHLIGTTPGDFQLAPGLYNVLFKWDHCDETVSQWVKIVSGQSRNVPTVKGCQ